MALFGHDERVVETRYHQNALNAVLHQFVKTEQVSACIQPGTLGFHFGHEPIGTGVTRTFQNETGVGRVSSPNPEIINATSFSRGGKRRYEFVLDRIIHEHADQTPRTTGTAGLLVPAGTMQILASSTTLQGRLRGQVSAKCQQEPIRGVLPRGS
ncbi:MAG: hypothetical protein ACI8TQ_002469 [Planctomycetota bacterium]|jgi:hypothetical protein